MHLEGCVTPEQVIATGRRNGVDPFASVDAARVAYDVASLDDFLEIYAKAATVLLHAEDFAEVASAYFDSAVAEGVRHVELMLDPQAHTTRGVLVETVFEGLARAQCHAARIGLSTMLIVNFMRERDEEEALEILASLAPYRAQIVAIGIDSAEVGHSPGKFTRLFRQARAMGLKLVAHAGFEGPPEDIEEALDLLQVDRIDHGNRVYERPALARRLGEAGTAVTVCPRSEVQLGVVASLAEHPVRQMLVDGMRPSLHSDDPAWFGSITENYRVIAEASELTRSEIRQLVRNSFTTSFLPASSVALYLAELDAKAGGGS
ncbi:adenosine deaminase [Pseudoduganella lurida]|uniref:Adenine deaminase n=1 Tax=Pseudoduganella lurida TaxID=1036180 RepID=A0A562R2G9_9BURK|nr:adenosine deaminase [Pseudoduganella lurida]